MKSAFHNSLESSLLRWLLASAASCVLPILAVQLVQLPAKAQVTFNGILTPQGSGFVVPSGVAVDSAGDIFVTDVSRTYVTELPAAGGAPITIGSGLSNPEAIAVDKSNNIYVADTNNNAIKEYLAPGYTTMTILGSGFSQPFGVAVNSYGVVFVADTGNALVKEIPNAAFDQPVKIVGGSTVFTQPESVAVDVNGNVYVADRKQSHIIELVPGDTLTYSTTAAVGSGLVSPRGVTADLAGNIFVTDQNSLKEITIASGLTATNIMNVSLSFAAQLTTDSYENVYIADENNSRVVKLSPYSVAVGTEPVGSATPPMALPFDIAPGTTVGSISIVTQGIAGLDFTDAGGSTCIAQTYSVSTTCQINLTFKPKAPGARYGGVVLADGNGNVLANVPVYGIGSGPQVTYQQGAQSQLAAAAYYGPMAVDGQGDIFSFTVEGNYESLLETPAGGTPRSLGGTYPYPTAAAVDGSGNVYFSSYQYVNAGNYTGTVTEIIAASGYTATRNLGSGFYSPFGLAVDGNGNVFVLDTEGGATILKDIPLAGGGVSVTTLTGLAGNEGMGGIAVDVSGNVFVAFPVYFSNTPPYQIQGWVEEIPAAGGYQGLNVLSGAFINPVGLAVDANDNVYVADTTANSIQELVSSSGYTVTKSLGTGLTNPLAVAVDASGNVYALNSKSAQITKMDLADPPSVTFATPTILDTTDPADGPQTVEVWNSGNQPLTFATTLTGANPSYPTANFVENPNDTNLCSSGISLAPDTSCDVSVLFEPTELGTISGSVQITHNALNVAGTTQAIALSGTSVLTATTTTLAASITSTNIGYPIVLTANVTAQGSTPTGTVYFLVDNVKAATMTLVSGTATATLTPAPGTHSVTATYPGDSTYQTSSSAPITITIGDVRLKAYRGSGQSAPYGSPFNAPLTVALTNPAGLPQAGQIITFAGKGVNLSSTTAVTDMNGVASVTATPTAVGSLSVMASYQSVPGAQFTLTATKVPLTLSERAYSVLQGEPIPVLHYSIAGFVNGDGPGVVTGAPLETTTATQASSPGTYPIILAQGTLAATNYTFVYIPGTLTITAPSTAASIVIENGNNQTTALGQLFPGSITALVKDSKGNPVGGATVLFAGTGLTFSPGSVLTNSSGMATVTAVGTTHGTVSGTATVAGTTTSAAITERVQ
jgi:hypothetical protein